MHVERMKQNYFLPVNYRDLVFFSNFRKEGHAATLYQNHRLHSSVYPLKGGLPFLMGSIGWPPWTDALN